MQILSHIQSLAAQSGMFEAGYIATDDLVVVPEVRHICEQNGCRNYGTSWACPPAIGTLEACKARINQYDTMLLFSKKYELEDSFDFEAMEDGLLDFKKTVDEFDRKIRDVLPEYLLLSNEGCGRCTECTYPHAPCRFPQLLHHSLEGYGFLVSELAKKAKIRYYNGVNTVTFFGALLFRMTQR